MSKELVEKVARAICTAYGSDPEEWWESRRDEARAAIRAVLAHFAEAGNVSDGMVEAAVDATWVRRSIAAAMAAALKEMEGP